MGNVAKAKPKRRITPIEIPKFSKDAVLAAPEFAEAIRNIAINMNHNFGACLEEIADVRERFSVNEALREMREGFSRIERLVTALAIPPAVPLSSTASVPNETPISTETSISTETPISTETSPETNK